MKRVHPFHVFQQEDNNPGCDIPITVEVWEPEVQTGLEDCLQVKLPWNVSTVKDNVFP